MSVQFSVWCFIFRTSSGLHSCCQSTSAMPQLIHFYLFFNYFLNKAVAGDAYVPQRFLMCWKVRKLTGNS